MLTYRNGEITRETVLSEELEKTHHVSPMMGMSQTDSFRATGPGDRLDVAGYHLRPEGAEVAR
jgi:DUF1365 family protein